MAGLALTGMYLNPILAVVFCLNLVSLIKKVKNDDKKTNSNTFWMSISFAYIVFSITFLILATDSIGF